MKRLIMKYLLGFASSNKDLLLKAVFFLLKKLVSQTDNSLDDKILEVLEKEFGQIDDL